MCQYFFLSLLSIWSFSLLIKVSSFLMVGKYSLEKRSRRGRGSIVKMCLRRLTLLNGLIMIPSNLNCSFFV